MFAVLPVVRPVAGIDGFVPGDGYRRRVVVVVDAVVVEAGEPVGTTIAVEGLVMPIAWLFCLWFAAQSACCKKHCLNDELNPPQSPLEEDE